jgi:hypothetical protein
MAWGFVLEKPDASDRVRVSAVFPAKIFRLRTIAYTVISLLLVAGIVDPQAAHEYERMVGIPAGASQAAPEVSGH